jgi:hypothetical protein
MAAGRRGYQDDLRDKDEQPSLVYFCPSFAMREFDNSRAFSWDE